MKKLFLISAVLLSLGSCSRVPITGRHQVNMLPENLLVGMSITNYHTFLTQHPAAPATASVASGALTHSSSADNSVDAEVPEIPKPKTPARGSAALCIDPAYGQAAVPAQDIQKSNNQVGMFFAAKVEEEIPREFRKVFRFSCFNKMQSACLPAVSEFNLPKNCFSSSSISLI